MKYEIAADGILGGTRIILLSASNLIFTYYPEDYQNTRVYYENLDICNKPGDYF